LPSRCSTALGQGRELYGRGWSCPSRATAIPALFSGCRSLCAWPLSATGSCAPDCGADTARAVFRVVYDYWRTLPKERHPRLYLFGLSLGARNSDLSADLFDVIADPYQGALWAGPPWDSVTWRKVTAMRAAGSPVWLPRFRDESLFHFTTQRNELNEANTGWGPMRMVFLQYPSDPIVFLRVPACGVRLLGCNKEAQTWRRKSVGYRSSHLSNRSAT
jgi:Alpha/beta-hydrolase family